MKRGLAFLLAAFFLLIPLSADVFDISLSFGMDNYRWPQNGISFSYGASFGLGKRTELGIYGISQATPVPFSDNMFGAELGFAILGRRSSGTKVAGAGINTLLSIGGFYTVNNNGAGVLLAVTPVTVGSPVSGRRERLLRTGAGWDFVNNRLIITFSLLSLDYYVRGSYRDYEF